MDTKADACGIGYLKINELYCLGTFRNSFFNTGLLDTERYSFEGTLIHNTDSTYTLDGRLYIKDSKLIRRGTFTASSDLTLLSGKGTQFQPDGSTLYGKWNAEGAIEECYLEFPTGYRFEGMFKNGLPSTGKLTAPDGSSIESLENQKIMYEYFGTPGKPFTFTGPGTFTCAATGISLKGSFQNSMLEGGFTGTDKNGTAFFGHAAEGKITDIAYSLAKLRKKNTPEHPPTIIFGNPLQPSQS